VNSAAFEFDEEEHVEAAQRDRLDREEIAGEHARGLLAQELRPARAEASRRGPKTFGKQDAPDRARRHPGPASATRRRSAGSPNPGSPVRKRDELADAIIDRRTAGASTRLRPLAADELSMPAQKRLWRHDQGPSPWLWQDSRQRGKEGAIGGAQRG
jgi:hypothetical protein